MPHKVGCRQGKRSGNGGPTLAHGPFLQNNAEIFKKAASGAPTTDRLKTEPPMGPRQKTSGDDLRLALVHLCATRYVQKRCTQKWLNILLRIPGTKV